MKTGINSSKVQKMNRNLILKLLLKNGISSRVQLANESHLEKATITNITNEFFSLGIIEKAGTLKRSSGRTVSGIKLALDDYIILSISISRKAFAITVFEALGSIILNKSVKISTQFNEIQLEQVILNNIDSVLSQFVNKKVLGMCASIPGPYIRKEDDSIDIVEGFESLTKINIEKLLKDKYDFYVFSMHDVKVCAYAEWKKFIQGKKKIYNSLLYIASVGSGVGAGSIIDGKILKGSVGTAGEIGHMGINFNGGKKGKHPNRGSFECYASVDSLLDYVKDEICLFPNSILNDQSTLEEIKVAYSKGDELAITAYDKLATMLGYGIANMVYILNPEICVIGGSYPRDEHFLMKVKETVSQLCYSYLFESLEIVFSDMDNPQLLGGYYLLIDKLINENLFFEIIKK